MTKADKTMAKNLADMMADVETISTDHADRMIAILDSAPLDALTEIVRLRVKFAWLPALSRLNKRTGFSFKQILDLADATA